MNDVATLITKLQDLNLPEQDLAEIVTVLTKDGLTEPVRRRIRSVVVATMNRDVEELERYERVLDAARQYNRQSTQIVREGEQALNRIDLRTKATFESMSRKLDEDALAEKAGTTLLLHTDDVAPVRPSTRPSTAEAAIQPKAAAAAVIAAAKRAEPTDRPVVDPAPSMMPSLPPLPGSGTLPATIAPLPPTPIAPPAVTQPAN